MARRILGIAAILVFAVLGPMPPGVASAGGATGESYIIVLRTGSGDPAQVASKHSAKFGANVGFVFRHALRGYSARLSPAAVAAIRTDPSVLFVSANGDVTETVTKASTQVLPSGVNRVDADVSRTRAGDGRGTVNLNIAVIDTDVDLYQPDLNVTRGTVCQGKSEDANVHGTHVAGSLAAIDNGSGVVGVAPGARIWAVKVLGKGGSTEADVICGIDWVTSTRTDADPGNDIALANMSLGGKGFDDGNCGRSNKDALHLAICNSVAAGVTYVVAAGNSGADFSGSVPAAYDEVLTVTAMADFDGQPGGNASQTCSLGGNSQADDSAAFFSNFASSADDFHTIAAPGVCILSTAPVDQFPTGTLTLSGTSMASPHGAGIVALCIASGACAGMNPAQIIQKIRTDAAVYSTSTPSYGFIGDPIRPDAARYYGFLGRAASY